jgi:hypothetical protein
MAELDEVPTSTFSTDRLGSTFREHLALDREYEPITAESGLPKLILTRHRQEGDTCSFRFDPLHPYQITYHGGVPVVRVHLERQVLVTPKGFRKASSTPPRGHIDHLPLASSALSATIMRKPTTARTDRRWFIRCPR